MAVNEERLRGVPQALWSEPIENRKRHQLRTFDPAEIPLLLLPDIDHPWRMLGLEPGSRFGGAEFADSQPP